MGAKQSKRSVDISGKEAEGAGEVAAAGAGGEGRVEALADADALKPQLNGDAHIHEQTDKEKQADSGTPENEKDATTEKEGKQEDSEKDRTETPVTNGDGEEQKTENGDSALVPEDAKKTKKEKVKKKWSLRSISFSRKDKPKQEKKQKDDEPKTNGEPDKVPEEAAEVVPEPVANPVAEVKSENETRHEESPETPVTEPITNGSNTPESPKVEILVAEETAPVASPESDKTETEVQPEPQLEQLPVNGLSLEETKNEVTEVPKVEESQPDESPADSSETVPAIEIPVQKEVCVEPMPLIESTPPPLPANPPPSSVASFAATTMAPDLSDASLANTTETVALGTKTEIPNENPTEIQADVTNSINSAEVPLSLNKSIDDVVKAVNQKDSVFNELSPKVKEAVVNVSYNQEVSLVTNLINQCDVVLEQQSDIPSNGAAEQHLNIDETTNNSIARSNIPDNTNNEVANKPDDFEVQVIAGSPVPPTPESPIVTPEGASIIVSPTVEDLPPPLSPVDDIDTEKIALTENIEAPAQEVSLESKEIVGNGNDSNFEVTQTNGIVDESLNGNKETENLKNKIKDSLGIVIESIECNGNNESAASETATPESPTRGGASLGEAVACAEPDRALQELLPVSDKLADLIPEVPVVPELKTETETAVTLQ